MLNNQQIFDGLSVLIKKNQIDELNIFFSSDQGKNFNINFIDHSKILHSAGDRKHRRDVVFIEQKTLLHIAIMENNLRAVEVLTAHKANLNVLFSSEEASRSIEDIRRDWTPVELALSREYFPIAKFLVLNGGKYRSRGIAEKFKDQLELYQAEHRIKLLEEKNKGLETENSQLKAKNTTFEKENDELKLHIGTYEGYLENSKDYRDSVVSIQTLIRGYLARKDYRKNYKKRKRESAKQLEEQASDVLSYLAKKKRFNDVEQLSSFVTHASQLRIYEKLISVKAEIATEEMRSYYLLLGEGNFSFALSLVANIEKKRKDTYVIASDFQSFGSLAQIHKKEFIDNINHLKQNEHVTLVENVDAIKIDSDKRLIDKSKRFRRIYFNCPHDGKSYNAGTLPKMLSQFFKAAHKLQKPGDKVYMILPKEEDENKKRWRYTEVYDIYRNTAEAGYVHHKKNKDVDKRYPLYKPAKANAADFVFELKHLKEHIFERSDYTPQQIKWQVCPDLFKNKECLPEESSLSPDSSGSSISGKFLTK